MTKGCSSPDLVCICSAVLPATEIPLHVPIEVVFGRFNRGRVVYVLIPQRHVSHAGLPRAADNNASVWSPNEIVVHPGTPTQHIRIGQVRWRLPGWRDNPAAYTFTRHNFPGVLRCEARCVCIESVYNSSSCDRATGSLDDPSSLFISRIGYMSDWRVRL
jgi:hypothetical protein